METQWSQPDQDGDQPHLPRILAHVSVVMSAHRSEEGFDAPMNTKAVASFHLLSYYYQHQWTLKAMTGFCRERTCQLYLVFDVRQESVSVGAWVVRRLGKSPRELHCKTATQLKAPHSQKQKKGTHSLVRHKKRSTNGVEATPLDKATLDSGFSMTKRPEPLREGRQIWVLVRCFSITLPSERTSWRPPLAEAHPVRRRGAQQPLFEIFRVHFPAIILIREDHGTHSIVTDFEERHLQTGTSLPTVVRI